MKTISIDLEAYELLCRARRNQAEPLSEVIRRAKWADLPSTSAEVLKALDASAALPESVFGYWEQAQHVQHSESKPDSLTLGERFLLLRNERMDVCVS